MKNIFLASFLSLSIFFVMGTVLVLAQPTGSDSNPSPTGSDSNPSVSVELQNPFACGQNCTLFTLLESVIDGILLPIGGVLAVLAFIYSGFLYVVAQGNEAKLKTAHKALLYTAVGTAVLLGSWVIAQVIENTINQLR
jgi:hypothetical protein